MLHADPKVRPKALNLFSRLQKLSISDQEKAAVRAAESISTAAFLAARAQEEAEQAVEKVNILSQQKNKSGSSVAAKISRFPDLQVSNDVEIVTAADITDTNVTLPPKPKTKSKVMSGISDGLNKYSEEIYVARNVDEALAALDRSLETEDGKRMLEEHMQIQNLDMKTVRNHLRDTVRQQTVDAAQQKFAYYANIAPSHQGDNIDGTR
jgi:hypothetical protein